MQNAEQKENILFRENVNYMMYPNIRSNCNWYEVSSLENQSRDMQNKQLTQMVNNTF